MMTMKETKVHNTWKALKGGKGKGKRCDCILISKNKIVETKRIKLIDID